MGRGVTYRIFYAENLKIEKAQKLERVIIPKAHGLDMRRVMWKQGHWVPACQGRLEPALAESRAARLITPPCRPPGQSPVIPAAGGTRRALAALTANDTRFPAPATLVNAFARTER
ncbi:hypothetical protein RRG08_057023 [Elysia crispata]|uniref:Uncharacterized protein n=1 Tax=Elysia crispata TaxID=231223 RepID=A0AAE0Z6L1_9GAST|nr:hypothetical protein RRG08_057023 [Elysia crispata]